MPETTDRPRFLFEIAAEIETTWGEKVSPYAKPYLSAMAELETVNDTYYAEDGRTQVLYFLSNASGWRGDNAKRIKAELKALLK